MRAFADIAAERERQDERYGGPDHDDEHKDGALTISAAIYALSSVIASGFWNMTICGAANSLRRFSPCGHKPAGPRRNLVKAAALLVSEIERLDRRTGGAADV